MVREVKKTYPGMELIDQKEGKHYIVTEQYRFFVIAREIQTEEHNIERYRCFNLGDLVTLGYEHRQEGGERGE